MNFSQIRAFHLVAREGGVARAATALGVSQPTISQHLKSLEARYGVQLFERRGRSLALTASGRDLLSVTERLMEAADEVEEALRRPAAITGGRLRLIADHTTLAVTLLTRFRALHPLLDLSLWIGSVRGIVEAVQSGAADVGIACDPPAGSSLLIEPLTRERVWVTVPAGHRFEAAGEAPVEALAEETLILREEGSRTRALILQAMAAHRVAGRAVFEVNERSAIREAIAAGLGVGFFVRSECPPDPRLSHAPLTASHARLVFDEYLILRHERRRQPAIAAFRALARRHVRTAENDGVPAQS